MTMHRYIAIHPQAPPQPAWGEPCNGCGVCCLSEPCPVGILLSRKRRGACVALVWDGADRRYRCGMLAAPARREPGTAGAARMLSISAALRRLRARWMRRWIAAGIGCDCDIRAEPD
jgi:hypothetical protein